jgi:glycosyltransferase involved in cell wall biosynthesis/GT2 family glycosyltransferase
MRFLLSYSSAHFDPSLPPEQQEQWGSSANVISRTLHDVLARRGEVTFIDAAAPSEVSGRQFDFFVGIPRNFGKFLEVCNIDRSVLVGVNMHPQEHNDLLLDFMVRERLPTTALHPLDLHDVEGRSRDIGAADWILLFGNVATLNSYVRHGVPIEKVKLVNYGSDLSGEDRPSQVTEGRTETSFLYCASEIGLRKGFDIVEGAMAEADLERLGARLHIAGAASYPHYRQRLEELEARLGSHVTNHGWLPANGSEYRELLTSVDYLFFPSLEEGQAGTVLDAMACGVIPLISANCGVDFAPLGFCELESSSAENLKLLGRACDLSAAERGRLREQTLEYYEEFHASFERQLDVAVEDLLEESPRPQVSVVLPVYEKEPTLEDLLKPLDRALVAYGNVDLCVILDGCSDDSEGVVRRFFDGRDDYPVDILTTPNIFEVRSNNLGLKRAEGRYAMIVQDDNFIYEPECILEAVTLMEKSHRAAIVGGLAGVNLYPRGTSNLEGPGQIAINDNEVYWRQDAATDPALRRRIFQVDACMRGPLFFSKAFLEEHGYLDEAYVPLYFDDMDICFRAASVGQKVYCILMDVENESLTQRHYDADRAKWFAEVISRNTDLFYSRWKPTVEKQYLWLQRTPIHLQRTVGETVLRVRQRFRRRYLSARRSWLRVRKLTELASGVRRRLGI